MKVMVIVKASKDSESGIMPSTELMLAMGQYNEELVKAGILASRAKACTPPAKACASASAAKTAPASMGPFAETKELAAGFWIWQVKSMEEAVEWLKRCPEPA